MNTLAQPAQMRHGCASDNWNPYPAYKDSGAPWLGEVPEHWEERPAFGVYSETRERNVGMKEYTVLSLSYGRIVVKPPEKLHGLVPESFETYQILNPGDIVLRTTDLQNDHTSLRVGLVKQRGIITSAYLGLRAKPGVTPEYGYQFLNVWDMTKAIYGYGSGLRQNLGFAHFKRMLVPVPTPEEQDVIVRFLDHYDRLIRKYIRGKQKLIALLTEQKQAIIQRAVTRGLNPDVKLKPSGVDWLGEIPEHWEVVALRIRYDQCLGKMLDAKQITGAHSVPYLRNTDVQWDRINTQDLPVMDIPPSQYDRFTLKKGDLLVCEGGEVGRCAFWKERLFLCGFQKALHRLRPLDPTRDYPRFLFYVMYAVSHLGIFHSQGSENTIAHLTGEKLRRHRFPCPPFSEQKEISNYLDTELATLGDAIIRAERQIELMREYRTRLIADVVTGKVDVREAAAALPTDVADDAAAEVPELAELEDVEDEAITDA